MANLLTTHSSLVQTFASFLTVVIHQVLSLRKIYPLVSFVSTRAYNYPVRQSRHPAVCKWVNDAVAMVKDQLEKNALANIAVCIFECGQNNVLERWVVDLRSFPVVDRDEEDAPFARVEDEESESGANETTLRRSVNRADLEAQFRAVISRLSVSAAKLVPLPSGDDAPELSFTVTMEVRDEADRPAGRRRLLEQGWIAAEPKAFESGKDGDETHLIGDHAAQPEGKTMPIRRLEAGELRMEVWVEESKAKFAMDIPATASSQQQSSESQRFDPDKGYVLDPADINRPQPPSMASDYRRSGALFPIIDMVQFIISPYNPEWPKQYKSIADDLEHDLNAFKVPYFNIEHVGSTSVPGLAAKPVLDIMIVIKQAIPFHDIENGVTYPDKTHYALIFGERPGGYRCLGDGGVKGRWSFKLRRDDLPARNLYVVVKDTIIYRSYLSLRETLRKPHYSELREEYAEVKLELAEREWADVMEYSTAKNKVVRKILLTAGWTNQQVDMKEIDAVKGWFGAGQY